MRVGVARLGTNCVGCGPIDDEGHVKKGEFNPLHRSRGGGGARPVSGAPSLERSEADGLMGTTEGPNAAADPPPHSSTSDCGPNPLSPFATDW